MIKYISLCSFIFLTILSSCTVNKAKIDNSLKKYFDSAKVDGSFSFLDNQSGSITVYNMSLDTLRVSPVSTFKIVNTLIGVQTGNITDTGMVIKWDGVIRQFPEWNKDLSMKEAFRVSSVPHFQEIARRIGKDTMQFWIDSLQYGNKNLNGPVDSFWLNGQLKISPDEQLGLVYKLYFDKLPFQKYAQAIVREAMLMEDNTLYKLSYKTGWDFQNNKVGWVVGWIEENRHVYFFATVVRPLKTSTSLQGTALSITRKILKEKGFFKGEK